jgi:hypothetical protein
MGFVYFVNRYYDPQTGQFLSVDPLVDETGEPYGYATDDPINKSDPAGLKVTLPPPGNGFHWTVVTKIQNVLGNPQITLPATNLLALSVGPAYLEVSAPVFDIVQIQSEAGWIQGNHCSKEYCQFIVTNVENVFKLHDFEGLSGSGKLNYQIYGVRVDIIPPLNNPNLQLGSSWSASLYLRLPNRADPWLTSAVRTPSNPCSLGSVG